MIPLALAQRNTTKIKSSQPRQHDQRNNEKHYAFPSDIIVVTNTSDSGPGSLRDALAIANDGDTIDATGISGTILLTSGELQISHAVTINGPGAGSLVIDGDGTFRVFDNLISGVTIFGFTITNGSAPGDNGGGVFNEGGNSSTLRLSNCIVSGNSADFGAGVFNSNGTLTVDFCTISGNDANFGGGGIANSAIDGTANLIISNSTISDNSAIANDGGGITNGAGGSASAVASVIVGDSTFSGNSATGNGGAIANAADVGTSARLTITNSTITANSAIGNGGGIYDQGAAEFEIGSTVLNAGSSGENIFNGGRGNSLGYNLSSDDGAGILTGPGDQINTDPMLGPLQDNGGPTFTHELLPGSPAIDAGDPSFTPPPLFDQRGPGFARVSDSRIDIGSFEVQAGGTPTPSPTSTPTATSTASPTPTATSTASSTPTSTPTATSTVSSTPTASPTPTSTARPTPTPRFAPTPRPRPTPAPRP